MIRQSVPSGLTRGCERFAAKTTRCFNRFGARSDAKPDPTFADSALVGAANSAARHDSAPMVFPQPVMILLIARPASLPDATEVEGIQSASLSVSPVRIRNA